MEAGVLNVDTGARDLSGDPGFSLISTHSPDSSPWALLHEVRTFRDTPVGMM